MLLINWCRFAPAPHWDGSLCACCIIQMALKACQINYRSFTRNTMSCPAVSGVTSRPRSKGIPPSLNSTEKDGGLQCNDECSSTSFWLSVYIIVMFYCRFYVIGSGSFMFLLTIKASEMHHCLSLLDLLGSFRVSKFQPQLVFKCFLICIWMLFKRISIFGSI